MKDEEYHVANFATFVSKTLVFQNGCNKVVIEPCAVQFWSEIILVISNRTRAMRSVDFWNHTYDFNPNCTPLSSIAIIYHIIASMEKLSKYNKKLSKVTFRVFTAC